MNCNGKGKSFPYAFGVFAKTYQSKWDRRMENYLSLGWTEEQIRRAFTRHPLLHVSVQ